jgi:hypothetical protein
MGRFAIGFKTGVIRADSFCTDSPTTFSFNWGARDTGSGQVWFDRGCQGPMELGIYCIDKGTFYHFFDSLDVDSGLSRITGDTRMEWPDWMD